MTADAIDRATASILVSDHRTSRACSFALLPNVSLESFSMIHLAKLLVPFEQPRINSSFDICLKEHGGAVWGWAGDVIHTVLLDHIPHIGRITALAEHAPATRGGPGLVAPCADGCT